MVKIKGTEFFLGCDPEVFMFDTKESRYVSAYGMIPGTKEAPHLVEHGMVQVDGMALEFGIDPSRTSKEFLSNIRAVMAQLQEMVGSRYELHAKALVNFGAKEMKEQPEEALELGCEPDFSAYTGVANPAPVVSSLLENCRSGGGHVHIGWGADFDAFSPEHMMECQVLAAQLDHYLGQSSLGWEGPGLKVRDDSPPKKRRELYGKAGAFRPKPYGMEYRTLSNEWLNSDDLIVTVFDRTVQGIRALMSGTTKFDKKVNLFGGNVQLTPRFLIESPLFDHISDQAIRESIINV